MQSFKQSNTLHERACAYIPQGTTSGMRSKVDPILFYNHSDGAYYYDVDGNRFLDYTLAWGPLILGSNHQKINQAVTDQLTKSYTLGAQHHLEIELAEKVVACVPGAEQVLFSNTGTEAVQVALRIARAKTNRNKFIKFEGHYHGWLNNVLVSYKPPSDMLGTVSPTCGGQPPSEYADTIVLPWNDISALEEAFRVYPNEIACVITEPLLANSGSCEAQEGYLAKLIELCRHNGALSIFDEVITGFRLSLGGARSYYNVTPDISVYGKAIAGGFTMSAVVSTKEIFDVLIRGDTMHAGTYNGTSINLAAALATLDVLSSDNCYERMHAHGHAIRDCIEQEAKANGIQLVTCGSGSVFSIHFGLSEKPRNYEDTLSADSTQLHDFRHSLLHHGVQCLPDGRWYVSAVHGEAELELVQNAITLSLQQMRALV